MCWKNRALQNGLRRDAAIVHLRAFEGSRKEYNLTGVLRWNSGLTSVVPWVIVGRSPGAEVLLPQDIGLRTGTRLSIVNRCFSSNQHYFIHNAYCIRTEPEWSLDRGRVDASADQTLHAFGAS